MLYETHKKGQNLNSFAVTNDMITERIIKGINFIDVLIQARNCSAHSHNIVLIINTHRMVN